MDLAYFNKKKKRYLMVMMMKNNLVLEKRLVGIGKTFVQKGVEYEHICK